MNHHLPIIAIILVFAFLDNQQRNEIVLPVIATILVFALSEPFT